MEIYMKLIGLIFLTRSNEYSSLTPMANVSSMPLIVNESVSKLKNEVLNT